MRAVEDAGTEVRCCLNCQWFEERTGFCRVNPPQVVVARNSPVPYPAVAFPKIPVPTLDWCSCFEAQSGIQ